VGDWLRVSVEEFVAASEAACRGGDASLWLSSFRKHPTALETAKAVLESSSSNLAQFQAILVIRDVIITHWDGLTPEQRELRTQLLGYLLASYDRCEFKFLAASRGSLAVESNAHFTAHRDDSNAQSSSVYERLLAWTLHVMPVCWLLWALRLSRAVRNIIVQAVCVAWKRGWLSIPRSDQEMLLRNLAELLGLNPGGAVDSSRPSHHELVGVQLCLQLVQQFSSDKASAVGMTVEFHRSCSENFQVYGLKEVFVLCLQKLFLLRPVMQGACGRGRVCPPVAPVLPLTPPMPCSRSEQPPRGPAARADDGVHRWCAGLLG
jgi:hypothetical protein